MTDYTHKRPRFMKDGVMAYPKRGWEPPPVPAGYRRKSDNLRSADAWIFIPLLPECRHRQRTVSYGPCGAASITYTCQGVALVDLSCCHTCEERTDGV